MATGRDFDVYGLGNALLDLQVNVAEQDLDTFGLEKGGMTLIDTDQRRGILDQFYRWANDDMIHPHVCATFPLDDFKEAMALVTARKSIGRVALVMNEGE